MFTDTSYAKTMTIAKGLINTYAIRGEIIADNIANVSTPNFKRSDVTFEYEMARALNSERNASDMKAKMTDSRHIPFDIPKNYEDVKTRIVVDYDSSYRNDKNNVDIDKEMTEEAKNTMRYQLFTQIVNAQYRQIRKVIGVS